MKMQLSVKSLDIENAFEQIKSKDDLINQLQNNLQSKEKNWNRNHLICNNIKVT